MGDVHSLQFLERRQEFPCLCEVVAVARQLSDELALKLKMTLGISYILTCLLKMQLNCGAIHSVKDSLLA
jgi:hypothetical protein